MIIEQDNFSAGLDLINPDTQVSTTGYTWLVNGRSRYGYIEPVTMPVELTSAPAGLKQGIITVGNSLIAFVAGNAWYKLYTSSQWIQVPGFTLDATTPNIYSCAVPASSMDYTRKLSSSGSVTDAILMTVSGRAVGMPTGIVCQDGQNIPQFITFDENTNIFHSRALGTFNSWTQTDSEYVPIGLQMMFLNQKLFIVAPDGLSVYQSVSGQPLNFMVNIDTNGDKLGSEASGGAATTSFAFDYDPITCLQVVNATDSFIYATKNNTRVITLNYNLTIFGEPLFSQSAIINTGIVNQYALQEISGDYAFASSEGLRDFNAVQQLKFSGRNSVFSKGVAKLFAGVQQDYVTCFSYNNYAFFSVNTVCGYLLAVYDTIAGHWSALDIFSIGKILQVATINLDSETRVYCATANKIYQLYSADATVAKPFFSTRAYSTIGANQYYSGIASYANTPGPITDLKSQKIDLLFRDGSFDGTVTCTEFCDGVWSKSLTKELNAATAVTPFAGLEIIQPLIEPEGSRVTFNFNNTKKGFKLSYILTWDNDASLMKIRLITTDINKMVSDGQKQQSIK